MNEDNKFSLRMLLGFIGLCFILAAFISFLMPPKSILNSLLVLSIGICMMMISMLDYSQNTRGKS